MTSFRLLSIQDSTSRQSCLPTTNMGLVVGFSMVNRQFILVILATVITVGNYFHLSFTGLFGLRTVGCVPIFIFTNFVFFYMQQLRNSRHRWLWIVLGLWLTLFQATVAAHSLEESLIPHDHSDCLLCHAGHLTGAAPIEFPTLHLVEARATEVAALVPVAPQLPRIRRQQPRAPPFL